MSPETTFFSYSRADSEFVLKLAKDLREAGARVWLDQLDIKPGSRWDASIEAALKSAHNIIVVLSATSVESNNVMDEVSFALESGKSVIPVLVGNCAIPFRLRRLQHIDFTTDYQHGLQQLLAALMSDDETLQSASANEMGQEHSAPANGNVENSEQEASVGHSFSHTNTAHEKNEAPQQTTRSNQRPVEQSQPVASSFAREKKPFPKKALLLGGAVVVLALVAWLLLGKGSPKTEVSAMQATDTLATDSTTVADSTSSAADTTRLVVGSEYGGGYVLSLDNTGHHGLIVASEDILDYDYEKLLDSVSSLNGDRFNAIEYACKMYRDGGYTDWRLPTAEELRALYDARNIIPNLYLKYGCCDPPAALYYSSTKNAKGDVFVKGFASGTEEYSGVGGGRLRPVRSF